MKSIQDRGPVGFWIWHWLTGGSITAHFMGTCRCQKGKPTAGDIMAKGFEEGLKRAQSAGRRMPSADAAREPRLGLEERGVSMQGSREEGEKLRMKKVILEYPDNFDEWNFVPHIPGSALAGPCHHTINVGEKSLSIAEWRVLVDEHNRTEHAKEVRQHRERPIARDLQGPWSDI